MVVGQSMQGHLKASLIIFALKDGLFACVGYIACGAISHSEQDSQYISV